VNFENKLNNRFHTGFAMIVVCCRSSMKLLQERKVQPLHIYHSQPPAAITIIASSPAFIKENHG
jgi:hypothetical protein